MPPPSPPNRPIQPMTVLQFRWCRALANGLFVDPSMFEIIQPCPPIEQTDTGLWTYQNLIPPATPTFNTDLTTSGEFFSSYASLADEQQFPPSSFEEDIGAGVYQEWTAYVASIQPPPTASQLPALFQSWAMRNAPSVVQIGTADLSTMALIGTAQQALLPYQGPNAQPVDFAGGFALLLQTLSGSSGAQLSFKNRVGDLEILNTASAGAASGIYGLWAGDNSNSRLSRQFALSHVTVAASVQAYTVWTSTPGAWYNSSLLNMAYSNQSTPPWPANADPTWDDLFGPEGGMRQLIASLIVVDAITATVTSDAVYSADDQQTILSNASSGLWPFFVPSSNVVSNDVSFSDTSGMQIDTVTQPGNPIVIGANVLGIAQYLGHASF